MSRWFDAYSNYKQVRRSEFESSVSDIVPLSGPVPQDRPMEFQAERVRPSRPPSVESDVLVPFGWASVVGVLSFGVSLYLALANGYLWHLSCLFTMIVMALVFIVGIMGIQKTLWLVEKISHIDLDGDNVVGQPSVDMSVWVQNDADKERKVFRSDLGITPDQLQKFAQGISAGKSLAVASWVGKHNIFTRPEFDRFMSELERLELVERDGNGSNAARVLTDAGKQAIEQVLSEI